MASGGRLEPLDGDMEIELWQRLAQSHLNIASDLKVALTAGY